MSPYDVDQIEIRPFERSVAVDGSAEKTGYTGRGAPLRRLDRGEVGGLGPGGRHDSTFPHVYGHDEPFAERLSVQLECTLSGESRGPDDHPGGTGLQKARCIRERTNAAGCLDERRRRCLREPPYDIRADPTGAGAVQVDDMDESRSRFHHALDERRRVGLARDDAADVTPLEPNGRISQKVDSGNHLETGPSLLSVLLC